MDREPLRSPSHRASFSDHEGRPFIPYRHVPGASAPYPASSESSASSFSSVGEEPSDHIIPEDSASRDRPPRSHVSVRSRHSAAPAAQRAASALSRHSSHHGAPIPPQARPDSRDDVHYERVIEREISRDRRVRHEAPPYPVVDDHRRPHPPPRGESASSLDSSESSSYDGPAHGRPYYGHGYAPAPPAGYPHQPYAPPRRPSYDYPGYPPAHDALMRMPPPDPYYRDRYGGGHNPYAMSPPPDPYYPSARPHHRPRPPSYHDPYGEAMVAYHNHHYPPPHHPAPPITYINQPPPPAKSPAPPTPKEDDPELKRLQMELAMIREAQNRDKAAQEQAERERKIRLEAEVAALKQLKADQEAAEKRKAEISAAEKSAREKLEAELKEKAKKAQEDIDKKAAEDKKKMEDLEKKKKELEEDIKKAKGDPDSKKAPVRLKDSVLDRKFDFPWSLAKKWSDTLKLLEQAYEAFPDLHRRVLENRFELVGPDRQIILPSVWETTIQPGWEITLLMPPDPTPHIDPLTEHLMMMDMANAKKKHKSSSKHKDGKDKGGSRDKKKKSSSRLPEVVDAPMMGGMPGPYAPGAMPMSGPYAPGPMPGGALFGTGPLPPMDGLGQLDPLALEKDERGKRRREKERREKKGGGGGFFGLGKR
ncbi:Hypothetical protein D9617_47g010970 [Elsinoe fawcettii]|nr:Hypothetical protein D9617_47g010970 [Elsinoe fawcettii]